MMSPFSVLTSVDTTVTICCFILSIPARVNITDVYFAHTVCVARSSLLTYALAVTFALPFFVFVYVMKRRQRHLFSCYRRYNKRSISKSVEWRTGIQSRSRR